MRYAGSRFIYYQFGVDIEESDLLGHPMDSQDEAFDRISYAMTLGLLKIYEDEQLTDDLVSAVEGSADKEIKLFDFSQSHPEVTGIMDSIFAARFSDFASGDEWKTYVVQNYTYDIDYVPTVFFANPGEYDLTEEAFVAGGFEFDENDFPQFRNTIPLWLKDSGNIVRLSTINESGATEIKNPIIILGHAEVGSEPRGTEIRPKIFNPSTAAKCNVATHVHEQLKHTEFKLNKTFEGGDNPAEYTFVSVLSATYHPGQGGWEDMGVNPVNSAACQAFDREVKKSDLGKWIAFAKPIYDPGRYQGFSSNANLCFDIASFTYAPQWQQRFCVAAYEYDWYADKRKLGSYITTFDPQPVRQNFEGRRKYKSEVYFFDDIDNNGYYLFSQWNPAPNTVFTKSSASGEVKLERAYW